MPIWLHFIWRVSCECVGADFTSSLYCVQQSVVWHFPPCYCFWWLLQWRICPLRDLIQHAGPMHCNQMITYVWSPSWKHFTRCCTELQAWEVWTFCIFFHNGNDMLMIFICTAVPQPGECCGVREQNTRNINFLLSCLNYDWMLWQNTVCIGTSANFHPFSLDELPLDAGKAECYKSTCLHLIIPSDVFTYMCIHLPHCVKNKSAWLFRLVSDDLYKVSVCIFVQLKNTWFFFLKQCLSMEWK